MGSTGSFESSEGSVEVLYAGSLVDTMGKVAPAFEKATGYTFRGVSAGSIALAAEIKGGTRRADVFVGAGLATSRSLVGAENGSWVSWFAQFGTTPLLIGYDPKSKFAEDLRAEPWYEVVTVPGFRLGRTDPAIDPKGVLAVAALEEAAETYGEPVLRKLATSTAGVFPEQDLVGHLQAGRLDGGFFYGVEATAANLPTVDLGTVERVSPYTITVLDRAPHPAGAATFVSYLLGPGGTAILRREGLTLDSPPIVHGSKSAVPARLKGLFG